MKDISPTKPESLLEDGRMGCHAVTQCLNTSRDEDDTELGTVGTAHGREDSGYYVYQQDLRGKKQ